MPNPKYCWDACVFIALLTNEQRDQEEINGILEVVDLVDRQQAQLLTSSLIRTEAIGDGADPTLLTKLEEVFKRPNCVTVDINRAISEKAGEIRAKCRASGRSLKTPDAIYIATALLHSSDALHTFDDKLLALSGMPEVDRLTICKPRASQTLLSL